MKEVIKYSFINEEQENSIISIQSRFGEIKVNTDKSILFNDGILGFELFKEFCLAEIPLDNMNNFYILQSIEDINLSMIVTLLGDYETFDKVYDESVIKEITEHTTINPQNMVLLGVVNIEKNDDQFVEFVVNLRAPIVVDNSKYMGYQHIISNDKYQIRKKINE